MVVKNVVITVMLLISAGQSLAMKRQGDWSELSCKSTKKQKVEICLQHAIGENNFDLFKKGISFKADVNKKDALGNPLFFTIVDKIDALRMQALQKSINGEGDDTIKKNNDAVAELYDCLALTLTENGFDANCPNYSGASPLHFLATREEREVNGKAAKMFIKSADEKFILLGLLKAGANPNAQDSKGNSVLHNIISVERFDMRSRKKKLMMVDTLISYGAQVNLVNNFNKTPLFYSHNDIRMVPLLLSHNACFNHKDNRNMMPIHYSTNPFVQYMLENERMVEKIKSELELAKREVIVELSQQTSMVQLLHNRQAGLKIKPVDNVHAKAVVKHMKNLSLEAIMLAMFEQSQHNIAINHN